MTMKKIIKIVLWSLLALAILAGIGTWTKFRPLIKGAMSVEKLDEACITWSTRATTALTN